MDSSQQKYPVGARVIIRDEEWRITGVEETAQAGFRLRVKGLSELVRGRSAVFYTLYEDEIRILKPAETALIEDDSPRFIRSKLYLEALFRTAPKTDPGRIEVASRAAMDPLPYQFDPALLALSHPRARILIADAVGIGKTLEAGILASELIARGRGRRILVLATKAMLSQFQQEFWSRFSIPLTRLDSEGIQRVRSRLPSSHNPFYYYDRAIISIDTLKQDSEYRHFLETARWDIIIIDEAHNVAVRSAQSQRARLAQLLASRSDTMILLSATPHDGRPESFASLLNILDPTAIPDPSRYRLEDFAGKGLVVRRFKKDIAAQVQKSFPDRVIRTEEVSAGAREQAVFSCLEDLTFKTLDHQERTGARLFSTTLMKAFFSSPAACRAVIRHRIAKLEKAEGPGAAEDIGKLRELDSLAAQVTPDDFSKLARLASLMRGEDPAFDWTGRDPMDRLVIFTESVETLKFLEKELPRRAGLKASQVLVLSGQLPDSELMARVNAFNSGESGARLLLCSDVASEGINLHHFAHRMIHFDIPWSLMTFQQRNGRIDRYGQTRQPQILYLQTVPQSARTAGDARVLERLVEKDRMVHENLADPAELAQTAEEQEARTAAEIEGRESSAWDSFFGDDDAASGGEAAGREPESDVLTALFGGADGEGGDKRQACGIAPVTGAAELKRHLAPASLLFGTDMAFAQAALAEVAREEKLDSSSLQVISEHRILLSTEIPDLKARLSQLPPEALPENHELDLTDDRSAIEAEMQRARAAGDAWPQASLLWPLHPVMLWLEDRLAGAFGRHSAPVLRLPSLRNGEAWALLQGGYPNRRGYIPVHRWVAVQRRDGALAVRTLPELVRSLALASPLSNPVPAGAARGDLREAFQEFVDEAVRLAQEALRRERDRFEQSTKARLEADLAGLAALKAEHLEVIAERYERPEAIAALKAKGRERRHLIERNFEDAERYIRDTADTEGDAYLQLAAVFAPAQQH